MGKEGAIAEYCSQKGAKSGIFKGVFNEFGDFRVVEFGTGVAPVLHAKFDRCQIAGYGQFF